jgi:hypothetical protein
MEKTIFLQVLKYSFTCNRYSITYRDNMSVVQRRGEGMKNIE